MDAFRAGSVTMKILTLLDEPDLGAADLRLIQELVGAKLEAAEMEEVDTARVIALWHSLHRAPSTCAPRERAFLESDAAEAALAVEPGPGRRALAWVALQWAVSKPQGQGLVLLASQLHDFVEVIGGLVRPVGAAFSCKEVRRGSVAELKLAGAARISVVVLDETVNLEEFFAGREFAFLGAEAEVSGPQFFNLLSRVRAPGGRPRIRRIVAPGAAVVPLFGPADADKSS